MRQHKLLAKILTILVLFFFTYTPLAVAAKKKSPKSKYPDLVAVKGGEPDKMFETGIKALGGMKRFIKKGQTVLVKPNMGWNRMPELASNTNPKLVGKIIQMAKKAGAKEVWVFDHAVNEEKACWKNSGIEKEVKTYKGKLFTAENKSDYRKVKIPKAKILKETLIHKRYLDADVIINVPILKDHMGTRMTCAIKNLMGVVWDRRFYHREGLHQTIADFPLSKKVDLTVVDAYRVLMRHGPKGGSVKDVSLKKMQILSTDMVLADAAAAKILGLKPKELQDLVAADAHGYGSMKLAKANIKRITLKDKK